MKWLLLFSLGIVSLFANNVEILESRYVLDANHTLNAAAVYEKKATLSNFDYPSAAFGFSNDTLWIYIKLRSNTDREASNVIEFLYAQHDFLHVYEYDHGQLTDDYLTGDMTPHRSRKIDTNHLVIPYTLPAGGIREFIFQIDDVSIN